jgi:hypothetical protein
MFLLLLHHKTLSILIGIHTSHLLWLSRQQLLLHIHYAKDVIDMCL